MLQHTGPRGSLADHGLDLPCVTVRCGSSLQRHSHPHGIPNHHNDYACTCQAMTTYSIPVQHTFLALAPSAVGGLLRTCPQQVQPVPLPFPCYSSSPRMPHRGPQLLPHFVMLIISTIPHQPWLLLAQTRSTLYLTLRAPCNPHPEQTWCPLARGGPRCPSSTVTCGRRG